ncbi:LOW QUALITY PROTEIN: hypothetical protein V2J09_008796 [Rumex salicifolius]
MVGPKEGPSLVPSVVSYTKLGGSRSMRVPFKIMAGASLVGHFIKHLTCTIPRRSYRFVHHLPLVYLSSFPRLPPPSGKFCRQWRPFSPVASISSVAASKNTPAGSFSPPCTSVLIHCRKDIADLLSEALLSFGASSVSFDEHDDYEDSDEVNICSIFTECEDVHTSISRAANSIGMEEAPVFEILKYNPYDWIKRTQESFDPVQVNESLWIIPEWKAPPDPEATNIILNPGLAFGTGEHATTKLCLQLLHGSVKGGDCFLDYGTGSGILSIAALKLGAALSVGVDIDPQAMTATHQNAILNHIGPDKLKLCLASDKNDTAYSDDWLKLAPEVQKYIKEGAVTENKYDVVIANILQNPLLDLAEEIVSHANEGAIIGLSGILIDQLLVAKFDVEINPLIDSNALQAKNVSKVVERYSPFLDAISVSELEDWACISGRKKGDLSSK